MRLRTLRPSDYDFIINRVDDWWGGRKMASGLPRLFFQHFADTSLVVEDQSGTIVAFVVGFMSPSLPQEAFIHYTGVDPAYQGQGLGRMMYEAFFGLARQKGRTLVRAITSPVNQRSIAFHTKMGFELEDSEYRVDGIPVHQNYHGPKRDLVLFVKRFD